MKLQIRSSKSEIRNKFKCPEKQKILKRPVSDFEFRFDGFTFVSDFDIRISDLLRWLLGGRKVLEVAPTWKVALAMAIKHRERKNLKEDKWHASFISL